MTNITHYIKVSIFLRFTIFVSISAKQSIESKG